MVVDPWGEIVAQRADDGEGLVLAEIDREKTAELRRRFH
jgi:nitrilase